MVQQCKKKKKKNYIFLSINLFFLIDSKFEKKIVVVYIFFDPNIFFKKTFYV